MLNQQKLEHNRAAGHRPEAHYIEQNKNDMFLSPWNLIQAILFALGIWWCKEMLSRFQDDLAKMREPDDQADRIVIIILWAVTALILLVCFLFAWNIGASIVHGIRDLR